MLKKLLRSAFLAALFITSFSLGANQSLNVYAASNSQAKTPRPTPTPAPPTTGPLAPDNPIPCVPGNPCGIH